MFRTISSLLLLSSCLFAVSVEKIAEFYPQDAIWAGKNSDQEIMLCLHGFGMDKRIGKIVHRAQITDEHIVAFNFPNHGEQIYYSDPRMLCIGTLEELRPIFERLHVYVSQLGVEKIHLYGFSLGGGAAINVLAILKTHRFQQELNLTCEEMDHILKALEKGSIILDCPLKSIDEMIEEVDPFNPFLRERAEIFKKNQLTPIDSLLLLDPSSFQILLCFAEPDFITSNRDDALFIQRLAEANRFGTLVTVICGEHRPMSSSLIAGYSQLSCLD